MRRFIAHSLRVAASALVTAADAIDVRQLRAKQPAISCSKSAEIETSFVTVAEDRSPKLVPPSTAKFVNMNVDDDSRLEWAELFLDWLYDNAPSRDQLTGSQIKVLAEQFNSWARVKGPPIGPYMFKWLHRVGINSTKPVRDQENHCPGKRARQRLYGLPPVEASSVEVTKDRFRAAA